MKHVEHYTPLFFLNLSLILLFATSGCLSVPSEPKNVLYTNTVTVTKKPVISRGQGVATRKLPWTKDVLTKKVNPDTGIKEWTKITLKGDNIVTYSYTWYSFNGEKVITPHYPDAWYHRFLKEAPETP